MHEVHLEGGLVDVAIGLRERVRRSHHEVVGCRELGHAVGDVLSPCHALAVGDERVLRGLVQQVHVAREAAHRLAERGAAAGGVFEDREVAGLQPRPGSESDLRIASIRAEAQEFHHDAVAHARFRIEVLVEPDVLASENGLRLRAVTAHAREDPHESCGEARFTSAAGSHGRPSIAPCVAMRRQSLAVPARCGGRSRPEPSPRRAAATRTWRHQSMTEQPQVKPAPNAASTTFMPRFRRPLSSASNSSEGKVAAVVLP